jgi:hypothetical protein
VAQQGELRIPVAGGLRRCWAAATWAGGVVWALGQVNFLFDRSTVWGSEMRFGW